jgi:hypothetical protein
LYILAGSGFNRTSLVIYDVITGDSVVFYETELIKLGWPLDPRRDIWTELAEYLPPRQIITAAAFHSGLIVLIVHKDLPRCFELAVPPTRIDRLKPSMAFLSVCSGSDISAIAIAKELVCVQSSSLGELFVFGRDLALKGSFNTTIRIRELYIRGRVIIGVTQKNNSIEFWQIKDTVDFEIVHFKSMSLNPELRRPSALNIGLSHNLDTVIISSGDKLYLNKEKKTEFSLGEERNDVIGRVDVLAAQHLAVYRVDYNKAETIILLGISNVRFIEALEVVQVKLSSDLGVLLECQVYFTTVVFFFDCGIVRLRLRSHELIHQRVVANSSSSLARAGGPVGPLDRNLPYPEDES